MISQPQIHWRRGLFRIWILSTTIWMCLSSIVIFRDWRDSNIGYPDPPPGFIVDRVVPWTEVWTAVAIPLAVLLFGHGIAWALKGFRLTISSGPQKTYSFKRKKLSLIKLLTVPLGFVVAKAISPLISETFLLWPTITCILSYLAITRVMFSESRLVRLAASIQLGNVIWMGIEVFVTRSYSEDFMAFIISSLLIMLFIIYKEPWLALANAVLGMAYGIFLIYVLSGMNLSANWYLQENSISASAIHASLYLISSILLVTVWFRQSKVSEADAVKRSPPHLQD